LHIAQFLGVDRPAGAAIELSWSSLDFYKDNFFVFWIKSYNIYFHPTYLEILFPNFVPARY